MTYERKMYAGAVSYTITLTAAMASGDLTFQVSDGSTLPTGGSGNFVVTVDQAKPTEEQVLCSNVTGNTVTVAAAGRGYAGSNAAAHSSGASVLHTSSKVDFDEANYAVSQTVGKVSAAGDLLVASGANALGRLAIGSANQLLTSNGTTATWATPAQASTVLGVTAITAGMTVSSATVVAFSTPVTVTATVPASGKVKFTVSTLWSTTAETDGVELAVYATAGANSGNTFNGTLGTVVGSTAPVLSGAAATTSTGTVIIYVQGLTAGSTTFELRGARTNTNSVDLGPGLFMVEAG